MLETLPLPLWYALAGLLGAICGSFANVVIWRLPKMLQAQWDADLAEANGQPLEGKKRFNLLTPNSHCPDCKTPVKFYDNVPVLGWLWLKGKCRQCKASISVRYPLVELLCGFLFFSLAFLYPSGWQTISLMAFVLCLVILAFIDLDTFLLPDAITLPLVWFGLLYHLVFEPSALANAVIGAMLGYLILWVVFHAFKLLTGKEGMGYGDFKLLAAAGAWLGVESLLTILLVSSVSGVLIGLTLQLKNGHDKNTPFPFGPALVFGMLSWLYGFNIQSFLV